MLSTINRALNLIYRSGRDDLKVETDKLDRKLRWIQATFEEVEHGEIHDETVKLWLQELKCLASDAEDVLDEYHFELLRCQMEVKPALTATLSGNVAGIETNSAMVSPASFCFSESISVRMIEDIRQINSQFDEISRDREALRLTNEERRRKASDCSVNLSPTGHLMNKDGIFGRSDDKKKIIDLLLSGVLWDEERKDQLQVIPILGMGGIGKTTLAQMVYDDPFVKSMFDVMAWVYVSPEFDILRLTKEISEFVTGNSGNSFGGFSKIQEVLQKELVGQTMLLVLDDVYNVQPNNWEILFLPLRVAKLVRVLVTSRSDAVAQTLHTVTPHRLHVLPEPECWKLFQYSAFNGKTLGERPWSLEIGRQIIKRCGRLPLAIKCIGGVLRYINDKDGWMDILESELWESDELEPVFRALKVSYYHFPSNLRECFLFCSLFPRGSRLRKISIIYMWMAHGFLQPKRMKRAEDLGEEYLDELLMRSFILPCTEGTFSLHDVIYDLARSISGGEIHTIVDEKSSHIPDKARHIYIKKGNNPPESFRPRWLRTFFNASLRADLYDIKSVRILGLIGSSVFALAYSPLKHLRYLGIMEFNGETLPESLCLLYHLQTLQITHCNRLKELPINIANLVNLRYVHIAHVGIQEVPVTLWQVHNLQTLRLKGCYNFRVLPPGISNLTNLHILQLKSCKQLEELPADTGNLINLTLLDLSFSGIRTLPASIGLLKSTKLVLVGVPARKQLHSDLMHLIIDPWDVKHACLQGRQNQSPAQDADDVEILRVDTGLNRLSCVDEQTSTMELPENPRTADCGVAQGQNTWGQKLILFGSQLWHRQVRNDNPATVIEDISSVSSNTWMSSRGQSSTAETMSHFSADYNAECFRHSRSLEHRRDGQVVEGISRSG